MVGEQNEAASMSQEISTGETFGSSRMTAANQTHDELAAKFWLLCQTGSHRFAIPIEHVVENMRMLPIETVADVPSLVRGLCIIRGEPIAVIDAALLFGEPAATINRLITVRTGQRIIALATESILGIRSIAPRDLRQLPPVFRDADSISSVVAHDEELVFFLRSARIVPDELLSRIELARAPS